MYILISKWVARFGSRNILPNGLQVCRIFGSNCLHLSCDLDHIHCELIRTRLCSRGGEATRDMNNSQTAPFDRLCTLAHDLNNGLAVIAGHCEIMALHVEPESESAARLRAVLQLTQSLATKLNQHECRLVAEQNPAVQENHKAISKPNNDVDRAFQCE